MRDRRSSVWLNRLFWLGLLLALAGIAVVRWELFPMGLGLLAAVAGALVLSLFGVILTPWILFRLVLRKPVAGATWKKGLVGLVPLVALLMSVGIEGVRAPAIHDITTDTRNPPRFELAAKVRSESDNPVAYEGDVVARLQRRAYPDMDPLKVEQPPQQVFDVVRRSVHAMGWQLLGVRQDDLAVEAVARSLVFGFEDDVVIRVQSSNGGSRVDIRSASRVGRGDLGANADRIRRYRETLRKMLESEDGGGR